MENLQGQIDGYESKAKFENFVPLISVFILVIISNII